MADVSTKKETKTENDHGTHEGETSGDQNMRFLSGGHDRMAARSRRQDKHKES